MVFKYLAVFKLCSNIQFCFLCGLFAMVAMVMAPSVCQQFLTFTFCLQTHWHPFHKGDGVPRRSYCSQDGPAIHHGLYLSQGNWN